MNFKPEFDLKEFRNPFIFVTFLSEKNITISVFTKFGIKKET